MDVILFLSSYAVFFYRTRCYVIANVVVGFDS